MMMNKFKVKNTEKVVKYAKKGFLLSSLTCCMFLSGTANASFGFSDVFNGMINTAAPSAYKTSRRGVIQGGSLAFRNPIVDISIASLTLPEVRGGCGGLDLFGGSFSFINKEQFVALMKSVGMNAISYAASLALKTICEQCFVIMEIIQKKIQEMNSFLGNSCQLAQGLINDAGNTFFPGNAFTDKSKNKYATNASFSGAMGDFFSSAVATPGQIYNAGKGLFFNGAGITPGSAGEQLALDAGNLFWEAFFTKAAFSGTTVESNLKSIGFSQDTSQSTIGEFLMSLGGTFIMLPAKHPKSTSKGGIIDFSQILYGSTGKYNPKVSDTKLKIYKCEIDEDGQNADNNQWKDLYEKMNSMQNHAVNTCTQMSGKQEIPYKPLIDSYKEILLGKNGDNGLIHKFASENNFLDTIEQPKTGAGANPKAGSIASSATLTNEEMKLVGAMNSGFGAMVRNLAVFDEVTAKEFAMKYIDILAAEVTHTIMRQLFQGIKIIASLNTGSYSSQLLHAIDSSKRAFDDEATNLIGTLGSMSDARKDYKAYMETFTKDRLNGMSPDDFIQAAQKSFLGDGTAK